MHDVSSVQRVEAVQGLIENVSAHALWDLSLSFFNYRSEASCIHKFEEEPQTGLIIIGIVTLDDVFIVFAFRHHCQLISDQGTFFVVFGLHKLKSELGIICKPLDEENFGKPSSTELRYDLIYLRGVFSYKIDSC